MRQVVLRMYHSFAHLEAPSSKDERLVHELRYARPPDCCPTSSVTSLNLTLVPNRGRHLWVLTTSVMSRSFLDISIRLTRDYIW